MTIFSPLHVIDKETEHKSKIHWETVITQVIDIEFIRGNKIREKKLVVIREL